MATECTLGDLLRSDRLGLTLLVGTPHADSRVIRGAQLLLGNDLSSHQDDMVLVSVHRPKDGASLLTGLSEVLDLPGSRIIVTWLPRNGTSEGLEAAAGQHILLGLPADGDPAELICEIARATALVEKTLTGRLTSLQRSLTQALAEPVPLKALTSRVAKMCNAVVTVIGAAGTAEYPTGPLPLSLLIPEISRTQSDSQTFAIGGWYGIAVRVATSASTGEKDGWLLATSRRASFPDRYSEAAVYIAASLAETSFHIDIAAQQQEKAVRSAVLEEALAMRLERQNTELAGRMASLGISFEQETRMIFAELQHARSPAREMSALENLYFHLQRHLNSDGIPHLLVLRENAVVGLLQASASTVRRTFVKVGQPSEDFLLGIGRNAVDVGHVVDSYHDAQLAVRFLRREDTTRRSMSNEEFDFATRLFSDVGLDKMGEWANELLRPLEDKQTMLLTLSTYFEHRQNIMEAADALSVHHNSLRYRLSKIESTLDLSLRDPAAVSSLFLALTALSMVEAQSRAQRGITPGARTGQTAMARGAEAEGAVFDEAGRGLAERFGAAVGPER
ncbi:PucR family transcriptional regulator [Streptomyces sp. NPDC004629]|uniref:PucR family transcriptional regulator n=1 Tax=Streptomyces sp. NPDC004629 TaxID=3364705 RepID=UPI0036B283BE